MQKFLKHAAGMLRIVQVVLVNLANSKQRIAPVLAAGIFLAQELILRNRLIQNLVIIEPPPHLHQRLRHGHHAGIGLGRSRRAKINAAISIDHALVVVPGSVRRRASVERLAHPFRGGKAVPRPRIRVARTGMGGHSRKGRQQQQRSPAHAALA